MTGETKKTVAMVTCDNPYCPNRHVNLKYVDWNDWQGCCEKSFQETEHALMLNADAETIAAFREVWGLDDNAPVEMM
jgi:hypothetical protein